MAGGHILAFPIDFDRLPYNTLALPCECVMVCCVVPRRTLDIVHLYAKFDDLSFSSSRDMTEAPNFKMGPVTLNMPLSGWFVIHQVGPTTGIVSIKSVSLVVTSK